MTNGYHPPKPRPTRNPDSNEPAPTPPASPADNPVQPGSKPAAPAGQQSPSGRTE